jgi:serine/threonine-protein kinase RsbT
MMRVEIKTEEDIIISRSMAKELAREAGFGIVDQTKIATAISELTRNIVKYALEGILHLAMVKKNHRQGLEITCEDKGPGIADLDLALQEGYSTGRGLGMGLPGVRKLMDEFELSSTLQKGTRVVARKWL